jgi:hypothetical protein
VSELGSLLGRWHQWRRGYTHERKFARAALLQGAPDDEATEDQLERLTMQHLSDEIEHMPPDMRLAIEHAARAECMGVEVMFSPRLPKGHALDVLVNRSLRELERRLVHMGVI